MNSSVNIQKELSNKKVVYFSSINIFEHICKSHVSRVSQILRFYSYEIVCNISEVFEKLCLKITLTLLHQTFLSKSSWSGRSHIFHEIIKRKLLSSIETLTVF